MSDDATFEQQALRCLDDVFRFSVSLTHNRDDAQDLVQETFLRAYRFWHTFQPGTDAKRWLFTICHHCFLRTRGRKRRAVEDDAISLESVENVVGTARGRAVDDSVLTQIDLGEALWNAIDRLAEPYRSVLILIDVHQQRYQAAAEILGIPTGTVRSRLFRARRQLQPVLEVYARDAGFSFTAAGGIR
ncbi:MAG TPA: sigma-70 family RNA polymerase sigma factor [Gemmatimonadaceae bacterium]|jgi:RNA polymerase sigma-70 factor, ECF subfamily|nr:sigma-70 family RNA polymerase sigma factor [Gemmatimonadaceae bacterium]